MDTVAKTNDIVKPNTPLNRFDAEVERQGEVRAITTASGAKKKEVRAQK